MEKISNSIKETLDIDPLFVKFIVIQIERKIADYQNHPEKYEECPSDIRLFLPEKATESESIEITSDEYDEDKSINDFDNSNEYEKYYEYSDYEYEE